MLTLQFVKESATSLGTPALLAMAMPTYSLSWSHYHGSHANFKIYLFCFASTFSDNMYRIYTSQEDFSCLACDLKLLTRVLSVPQFVHVIEYSLLIFDRRKSLFRTYDLYAIGCAMLVNSNDPISHHLAQLYISITCFSGLLLIT